MQELRMEWLPLGSNKNQAWSVSGRRKLVWRLLCRILTQRRSKFVPPGRHKRSGMAWTMAMFSVPLPASLLWLPFSTSVPPGIVSPLSFQADLFFLHFFRIFSHLSFICVGWVSNKTLKGSFFCCYKPFAILNPLQINLTLNIVTHLKLLMSYLCLSVESVQHKIFWYSKGRISIFIYKHNLLSIWPKLDSIHGKKAIFTCKIAD